MLKTILEGVALGLTLSILLGPAFFTLLQTSVDRGLKAAIMLAIGIFASDLFLVFISFLGASKLLGGQTGTMVVGIVGGSILVCFGLYTYLKRGKIEERKSTEASVSSKDYLQEDIDYMNKNGIVLTKPAEINPKYEEKLPPSITYVLKGFFLNMANPTTWLFWFFWVGVITAQYSLNGELDYRSVVIFFSFTLFTVLAVDIAKSFIANQLRRFVTPRRMSILNKIVGVVLFLFGLYLIIQAIFPSVPTLI